MKASLMARILILAVSFCIIPSVCAQYHCTLESSTQTTVTFRVEGFAKNAKKAVIDAETKAVQTVLYSGVPGTAFSRPLIEGGKAEAEKRHEDFFKQFYKSDYKDFVEAGETVKTFSKDKEKRKVMTLDVTVRVAALRNYLENNKIIRKFGL